MTTIKKHQTEDKTQFIEVAAQTSVDFDALLKKQPAPLNREEASFQTEEQSRGGCGHSDYIGLAVGLKLPEGTPITVKSGKVNHLKFDRDDGSFVCRRTGSTLYAVPYLILMENCTSAYVEE